MQLYGIWCKDEKEWLKELPSTVYDGGEAILAYTSRQAAQKRAAEHYGFDSYTEVHKADWAEVRPL